MKKKALKNTELAKIQEFKSHTPERNFLHKDLEIYALTIAGVKLGPWDWDITKDTMYYAPEFREVLGYDGNDFKSFPNKINLRNYVHPDDQERVMWAFVAHLEEGKPFDLEQRCKMKTGEYRHFRSRAEAIRDETGRPVRMLGAIWDINDEKDADTQLRQRQKMEALGHMAGGVAHEINNFLQPILLSAENAKNKAKALDADIESDLDTIYDNARMAAQTINDILVFSRGAPRQKLAPLNFLPLLENSLTFTEKLLPDTICINLSAEINDNVQCNINDREFKQIIANILLNASQAMNRNGTVEISTTIEKISKGSARNLVPDDYICLRITDHGTGIPEDIQDKIFEPFFTTKDIGEGSGLGLAIVFGILKDWNGTIFLEKSSPSGTEFAVYIPVAACE